MKDWRDETIEAAAKAVRENYAANVEAYGGPEFISEAARGAYPHSLADSFFRGLAMSALNATMRSGELELAKQLYVARVGSIVHVNATTDAERLAWYEEQFLACIEAARAATKACEAE